MMLALFDRVVLIRDLPDDGLPAGDVGVIVEHYPATAKVPEGYELEVFAANGKTLAPSKRTVAETVDLWNAGEVRTAVPSSRRMLRA